MDRRGMAEAARHSKQAFLDYLAASIGAAGGIMVGEPAYSHTTQAFLRARLVAESLKDKLGSRSKAKGDLARYSFDAASLPNEVMTVWSGQATGTDLLAEAGDKPMPEPGFALIFPQGAPARNAEMRLRKFVTGPRMARATKWLLFKAGGGTLGHKDLWVQGVPLRSGTFVLAPEGEPPDRMERWAGVAMMPGAAVSLVTAASLHAMVLTGGEAAADVVISTYAAVVNALRRAVHPYSQDQRKAALEAAQLPLGRAVGGSLESVFSSEAGSIKVRDKIKQRLDQIQYIQDALEFTKKRTPLREGMIEAKEKGWIKAARITPGALQIDMTPLQFTTDKPEEYGGIWYPEGTYELQPATLSIPEGGDGRSVQVYVTDGGYHPHPHIQAGPGSGRPCWGEGTDKQHHMDLADVLFAFDPARFVSFMRSYLLSRTDRSLYSPLQAGARYVRVRLWKCPDCGYKQARDAEDCHTCGYFPREGEDDAPFEANWFNQAMEVVE